MTVEFRNVCLDFPEKRLLDNISVIFSEMRVGIIGDNGCGKSSLVRLMNGLLTPSSGNVLVNQCDVAKLGSNIHSTIGFLFQNPDNQIIMPTVEEDIELGLKPLGLRKNEINQRVTEILQYFEIDHLAKASAHTLSGGEKQLVALAGVMINSPDILICDEPTTLLDLRNSKKVIGYLQGLSCQVILVTHEFDHLSGFDRVIVLGSGKIIMDGKPSEVIGRYLEGFH